MSIGGPNEGGRKVLLIPLQITFTNGRLFNTISVLAQELESQKFLGQTELKPTTKKKK